MCPSINGDTNGHSFSSVNLNSISLQPPPIPPQVLPHSRVSIPSQSKRPSRKSSRPSTAPAKEDLVLLPSLPPDSRHPSTLVNSRFRPARPYIETTGNHPDPFQHMQTLDEDLSTEGFNLGMSESARAPPSPHQPTASPGLLPSPFDTGIDEMLSSSVPDYKMITASSECDWATFMHAYALGRWDPHRTPNPPRSYLLTPAHLPYAPTELPTLAPPAPSAPDSVSPESTHGASPGSERASISPIQNIVKNGIPTGGIPQIPEIPQSGSIATPPPSAGGSLNTLRRSPPSNISLPSHRLRNSFSTSSTSYPTAPEVCTPGTPLCNTELQTTVATMRWAAARVDISPLALPSPEHELTDPMRGVTAAIPGSHPSDPPGAHDPTTPGGRKTRLTTFWQGTQDVEDSGTHSIGPTKLTTIIGSPSSGPSADTPPDQDNASVSSRGTAPDISDSTHLALLTAALPASAPALRIVDNYETGDSDYFGFAGVNPVSPPSNDSSVAALGDTALPVCVPAPPRLASPLSDPVVATVPALPRRVCLTRQTSSPLPASSPHENRFIGRIPSENVTPGKVNRSVKEEQMFAELGYLAPPNPPDELERRRALYKFNIWNTGPDLNFDRIAHLAKLVFSTKGVVISLIDGQEQWFKSEWGIKTPSGARIHSFCGHSILQRGDEPMVILDTRLDWRFSKNPLVTGPPNIRFYAGAPLRTQDGYNIGTLAVIDHIPRDDFTPRQRHTLKEFAAIAMREMELWRDKIQLRIRDRIQNSMEQFSRECLEIDTEGQAQNKEDRPDLIVGASMDKVYDRAAKLVKRTLDVEGVIVMDVSLCEVLESMNTEGTVSVVMHHGDPQIETTTRQLSSDEYHQLNAFFAKHPDGKISEGIVPPSFRPFLPTHIQYALSEVSRFLAVPIFNIDKRPFALLCAYNASDHTKRFLEGHELSYLRAIGVIILSAVLKRRMILADKAKSLFISNISHELRTPLHGILAAAELLNESTLNHSQLSFLQTVQACGTSLVETVNHVLDFTKLSGNSKSGGVENVIVPSRVDLMQLVEEAIDGCWIGHRARTAILGDSAIGSVTPHQGRPRYLMWQPRGTMLSPLSTWIPERGLAAQLEIHHGGHGFVHVLLRQLPRHKEDPPNRIKIELAVLDTGKGISQNFLKNQLFHPFSQENPLQTGTGLGLAIVNSIVQSESVGGKVDVWSEEGAGTEIKVTFYAEALDDNEDAATEMEPFKFDDLSKIPTISLVGFDDTEHKGTQLLSTVLQTYLTAWWGFKVDMESVTGDIVIINTDPSPIVTATEERDTSRPFIILSSARGNPAVMAIASEHERIGGFCRIIYKPGGPSRLRSILKLCVHTLNIGSRSRGPSPQGQHNSDSPQPTVTPDERERHTAPSPIPRRNSEESRLWPRAYPPRPSMTPRSTTAHPFTASWQVLPPTAEKVTMPEVDTTIPTIPTVDVGTSGTLLKSSIGTIDMKERQFRVLVVEDNSILRNLLIKWLSTKGYDFRDAVDGRDGVNIYQREGPFDVVLLDLSMPILDGVAATAEIRHLEADKLGGAHSTRILALTGMSSLEDKRRAFEAGVDGYLVKPVAFKTLDEMFHKLGIP
ncbi:hypothetical protein BD779DRAFT_1668047 [Infundibulicybe gibba]|nr:hypothetical protein BD779DRAFT_1668047 [Infundibulicybe gibba]